MKKLSEEVLREQRGKSFVGVSTNAVILNRRGQIFMAQRSKNARDEHGMWDICGGGLDWGNSVEDNVRMEMKEEFGVVTDSPLHPIGYRDAFRSDQHGDKTHWLAMDFVVILDDEEAERVAICEPDKFDDCGWFDFDNLPSPRHSALYPDFLARVRKKFAELQT